MYGYFVCYSVCKQIKNYKTSKKTKNKNKNKKLAESRSNPRNFWKTLKQVLPNKNASRDTDRLIIDDKEVTAHNDIADALNLYFTSIASSLLANSNEVEPEFVPDAAPSNIESFKFTLRNVNEVSKAKQDRIGFPRKS